MAFFWLIDNLLTLLKKIVWLKIILFDCITFIRDKTKKTPFTRMAVCATNGKSKWEEIGVWIRDWEIRTLRRKL